MPGRVLASARSWPQHHEPKPAISSTEKTFLIALAAAIVRIASLIRSAQSGSTPAGTVAQSAGIAPSVCRPEP